MRTLRIFPAGTRNTQQYGLVQKEKKRKRKINVRGRAGIEPATSPTRTENHTSRPTARVPVKVASSEDRTRDLALTRRMLCQLSYRGDCRAGARVGKAAPGSAGKKGFAKRTCSTGFEPATPRFEVWCAIHCATSTCSRGARGGETMLRGLKQKNGKKIYSRQLRDSNSRGQCPIDF